MSQIAKKLTEVWSFCWVREFLHFFLIALYLAYTLLSASPCPLPVPKHHTSGSSLFMSIISSVAMVIWVKAAVFIHVLHNLDENNPLNVYTEDAKDGYRSVVLGF